MQVHLPVSLVYNFIKDVNNGRLRVLIEENGVTIGFDKLTEVCRRCRFHVEGQEPEDQSAYVKTDKLNKAYGKETYWRHFGR